MVIKCLLFLQNFVVTLTLCDWYTHTQVMLPICHLQNILIHFKLSQKQKCSVHNVGKLQLLEFQEIVYSASSKKRQMLC